MSGIPISGSTTTAATAGSAAVVGTQTDASSSASGVLDVFQAQVSSLPFTGIGLLSLLVAAFTLLACGLALLSLARPALRSAARPGAASRG